MAGGASANKIKLRVGWALMGQLPLRLQTQAWSHPDQDRRAIDPVRRHRLLPKHVALPMRCPGMLNFVACCLHIGPRVVIVVREAPYS
jgi:hypothetical protein